MTDEIDTTEPLPSPDFSTQQWELIGSAPALVFVAMAMADRSVSTKERDLFFKKWMPRIVALKLNDDEMDEFVLDWGMGEAEVHLDELLELPTGEVLDRLENAFTLLASSFDAERVEEYRLELIAMAKAVAKASGDWFGVRSPVRDSEESMLRRVRHALRGRPVV